jgi:hypothetical protein
MSLLVRINTVEHVGRSQLLLDFRLERPVGPSNPIAELIREDQYVSTLEFAE